eukprot:6478813-Alexandrium_andersonii.AAC.1
MGGGFRPASLSPGGMSTSSGSELPSQQSRRGPAALNRVQNFKYVSGLCDSFFDDEFSGLVTLGCAVPSFGHEFGERLGRS